MSSELWAGDDDGADNGDVRQALWGCGRAYRYGSNAQSCRARWMIHLGFEYASPVHKSIRPTAVHSSLQVSAGQHAHVTDQPPRVTVTRPTETSGEPLF